MIHTVGKPAQISPPAAAEIASAGLVLGACPTFLEKGACEAVNVLE